MSTTTEPVAPAVPGYEFHKKLGEGGMGGVYLATQLSTRRQVALKLLEFGRTSQAARIRFLREVELTARLDHPYIARVYDSTVIGDMCCYAMEFIEGQELGDYIVNNRLPRRQSLELMAKVCEAVQHAHQKGIIHRDLKPSNVMVTADGLPKVVDFGLAKNVENDDPQQKKLTRHGEAFGTPGYMAPEQAAGLVATADTRTDVYAIGAILYVILTDRFPHDIDGPLYKVLQRIVELDPTPVRQIKSDVDDELNLIVMKALSREMALRYQTAGELGQDLLNYLNGDPLLARKPTIGYVMRKRIMKHKVRYATLAAGTVLAGAGAVGAVVLIAHERDRAVAAEAVAKAREQDAQNARAAESAARQIAEQNAEAVRQALYIDRVRLAAIERARGGHDRAAALLEACPLDLRGWEWRHLVRPPITATRVESAGVGAISAFALDDSSGTVAVASGPGISVIPPDAARPIPLPRAGPAQITALVFLSTGELVSGDSAGVITAWNLQQRQPETLANTGENVRALAALSAGQVVAGLQDGRVLWLAPGSQRPLDEYAPAHRAAVNSLVVRPGSAGGVIAVAWANGSTALLDGKQPRELPGIGPQIFALTFSRDGTQLCAADIDGVLNVYNAATRRLLATLRSGFTRLAGVSFLPDGRLAAADHSGQLKLFDIQQQTELADISTPSGVAGQVRGLMLVPENQSLLAASDRGELVHWLAEQATLPLVFRGHAGRVTAVAASDQRVVSVGVDGSLRVWDAHRGTNVLVAALHAGPARATAVAPDGGTVVSCAPGELGVAEVATGQTRTIPLAGAADAEVIAAVFVNDHELLIGTSAASFPAAIINVRTGEVPRRFIRAAQVPAVAANTDRTRYALGDATGQLEVFAADGSSVLSRQISRDFAPRALAMNPAGDLLAWAGDGGVEWVYIDTQNQPATRISGPAVAATFVPAIDRLAIARPDGRIELYAPGSAQAESLVQTSTTIAALAAGTETVIAAAADGTVRVYPLRAFSRVR